MRQTLKKLSFMLLLAFGLNGLMAQEAVTSAGGSATGSGGSASYSIGQVVYTTNIGPNGSVAQGVQQPYEISVITGVEQASGIDLTISAFPNPTNDVLILNIGSNVLGTFRALSYHLSDMNGKLLENKRIVGTETTIDMNNRSTATYLLSIYEESTLVKTFKIIKS